MLQSVVVVVVVLVHSPCMCEQLEISALNDPVTGVGWLLAFKVQLAKSGSRNIFRSFCKSEKNKNGDGECSSGLLWSSKSVWDSVRY